MRAWHVVSVLATLAVILPRAGTAQSAPPRFRPTALSGGTTLNHSGQFAGSALTGEVTPQGSPVWRAARWDGVNTRIDLGTLPGGVYSAAVALNDLGQAAGWSEIGRTSLLSSQRVRHAVLWDPQGGPLDLGALGSHPDAASWATALNDEGQVVGMSSFLDQRFGVTLIHAFIWDRTRGIRDLGTESVPQSINNRGEVLFTDAVWTEQNGFRPLEQVAGPAPAGVFALSASTGPHGINDAGQFPLLGTVGLEQNGDGQPRPINLPLRRDPGQPLRVLDPNGASTATEALAINASGQVVGVTHRFQTGFRHFLYDDRFGALDLNTLLAEPDWRVERAADLNDTGQVLGTGRRPTLIGEQFVPLLLTPEGQNAPVRVLELYVRSSVIGGQTAPGVVVLGQPAPSGGAVVQLSLADPSGAVSSSPQAVTVPAGQRQAQFAINTRSGRASENAAVVIVNASYAGVTERAALGVLPSGVPQPPDPEPPTPQPELPEPQSLTLQNTSVVGGGTVDATLTLTQPAPTGGIRVLVSTDSSSVDAPGEVLVRARSRSATFRVTTRAVTAPEEVVISASRGSTQTATLTVLPAQGDQVTVVRAVYTRAKQRLVVESTSSSAKATLTAYGSSAALGKLKALGRARFRGEFKVRTDPGQVTVRSSRGGVATTSTQSL